MILLPFRSPLLVLRSLPVSSGFLPPCKELGRTGACLLFTLPIPHPGHVGVSPGSPPSSLHRWFSHEVSPRLDRDLRHGLSAMVFDLQGVLVDVFSDNFLPVRENPVYSVNLHPSALRLKGLARWGHDHSSASRPSRHRQGPPPAPFAVTRTAAPHITFPLASLHHNARAAWAHSCGISLPEPPALAQHSWYSTPSMKQTPQIIRAHILLVGHTSW